MEERGAVKGLNRVQKSILDAEFDIFVEWLEDLAGWGAEKFRFNPSERPPR